MLTEQSHPFRWPSRRAPLVAPLDEEDLSVGSSYKLSSKVPGHSLTATGSAVAPTETAPALGCVDQLPTVELDL